MKKIIILIIIVLVLGVGGYYFAKSGVFSGGSGDKIMSSGAEPEAIAEIPSYQYTEEFVHPTYNFSFKYPADFTVTQIPEENGEVILIQNISTKIGVQIMVTAFEGGEDIDLTADILRAEIPDLEIKDEQEVIIGSGRKGIAFVSDNEAFGGNSREVWFVFRGNLYQISTYAELDEFLKGIFGTWKFTQ